MFYFYKGLKFWLFEFFINLDEKIIVRIELDII